MVRPTVAALLMIAFLSAPTHSQDAGTRKLNRAIHAQEKEILRYVTQRIEFDKKIKGSAVTVVVQPGGVVVLSGAMRSPEARDWMVQLAENTVGVTSVVDELTVAKAPRIRETGTDAAVIEVARPVVAPVETVIITRP